MAKDLKTKLRIDADTKGAQASIKSVQKGLGKTGTAADKTSGKTSNLGDSFSRLGRDALGFNQILEAGQRLMEQATAAIDLADQYRLLKGRIDNTTKSQAETNRVMEELTRISLETHKPLESTAELYARLAVNTEEAGYSQNQLLGFTESINNALAVNGTNASEASGALLQLSQAMASGVLRGEEFNSVNEQMPAVIGAIAEHLGVTRGELRKMAEQGKLTADVVLQSTLAMGDTWKEQAALLPTTMGKAITDLETSWQSYLGQSDAVAGASEALASTLGALADHLDTVAGVAGSAALAAIPAIMLKAGQAASAWTAEMAKGAAATRDQALALQEESALQTRRTELLAISTKAALNHAAAIEAEARATLAEVEALALEIPPLVRSAALTKELTAARSAHTRTLTAYSAAQQRAALASKELADAETAAAAASGGFGASIKSLVSPMNLLQAGFAGLIGYDIGTWLSDQSATVRKVGTAITSHFLHEFEVLRTGWEVLSALLTDDTVVNAIKRHLERTKELDKTLAGTYEQAKKGWKETGDEADKAGKKGADAGAKVAEGWQAAITALGSAKSAASGLKSVFDELVGPQSINGKGLDELVLAMTTLGEKSNITGEAINNGLRKALADLSGKELLEMQQQAAKFIEYVQLSGDKATEEMRKQADAALAIMDGTLGAAMDKLGAVVKQGSGDVVDTLQVVLDSAIATGDQITASVGAALSSANMDTSGIEDIKRALQQAQEQGRITFTDMQVLMGQADAAARALAGVVTGPLLDAYKRMGIAINETKTASTAAAKQAKLDFELIIRSADTSGEARVKAAEAYLAAEKKAHDGVLPLTADVTKAQEILAKAIRDAGDAGTQAGSAIAAGMNEASTATDSAAAAADRLAAANEAANAAANAKRGGASANPSSIQRDRVKAQGDAQALADFDAAVAKALDSSRTVGQSIQRQLDVLNSIADKAIAQSNQRAAAGSASNPGTSTSASSSTASAAPAKTVHLLFGNGQKLTATGNVDEFLKLTEQAQSRGTV